MPEHKTALADEGQFVHDGDDAIDRARALHHLASADPEPERDGLMTGPAHERKYGLERAEASEALWRASGVHPIENRALVEGEDGAENLRGAAAAGIETTAAPRASDTKKA
jgi:hypothetical protein